MLFWFIKITLISIIIILVVHHLINFFKNTLTVPKLKDLVNGPNQKYENIYNTLTHKKDSYLGLSVDTTDIDQLLPKPIIAESSMKEELKNFLKSQMNSDSNNNSSTDISALDSMIPNDKMYAAYN
jgi:hypothetical protein